MALPLTLSRREFPVPMRFVFSDSQRMTPSGKSPSEPSPSKFSFVSGPPIPFLSAKVRNASRLSTLSGAPRFFPAWGQAIFLEGQASARAFWGDGEQEAQDD